VPGAGADVVVRVVYADQYNIHWVRQHFLKF